MQNVSIDSSLAFRGNYFVTVDQCPNQPSKIRGKISRISWKNPWNFAGLNKWEPRFMYFRHFPATSSECVNAEHCDGSMLNSVFDVAVLCACASLS